MVVLRSTRVVVGDEVRPASIGIEQGRIVAIDDRPGDLDFGDLVIMPGLVDGHVHVNEPGRSEWEGFATATRAAAAGGTTTIVDMPLNSIPATVTVAALAEKRGSAMGKLTVDTAFWGGLIPGSEDEIGSLAAEGVCGFKSFLVDSGVPEFPPMGVDALAAILPVLGSLGLPALIHAEDPAQIHPVEGDATQYRSYLASRPARGEGAAVEVVTGLARRSGARMHVLHISSAEAVGALAAGPDSMSGETCPHYLTFSAEEIPVGATPFKCAPPIRTTEHREALWQGLLDGTLSMVVSDHSPAPPEVKGLEDGDFATAWGGIGSLQLRLPATWTGASERGVDLHRIARWLSLEPARLAGLDDRKGAIALGWDGDLVVWNPDGALEVRGRDLEHRHPITPYEGMKLRGRVVMTMLGGKTVFDRGAVTPGNGRMLRRNDRSDL
ncbi:MAG TPA: allantoinase AllB [Acidimicrobiia bacterium]|nr:allantoinase AllB [Acidimicrobiia bacterium]